jgi:hypothetical protein
MNDPFADISFSEKAFKKHRNFILKILPFICRELTKEERDLVNSLRIIPSWLGSL